MIPLFSFRSYHPLSFYQMQKTGNENKEEELQQKRDAQTEADKSSTIRGFFGPINKNKRLDTQITHRRPADVFIIYDRPYVG